MPSSISNSEPRRDLAVAWAVLAAVAVFLAAGEIGIRIAYPRLSVIESRIAREYREAQSIRRAPGALPAVLILGNSLLLEALDYPLLRRRVELRARVVRFAIEGAAFTDWHYGIRRLLAAGSRPDVIVLCLSAPQLVTPGIRGDYSSYYLFQLSDIPAIGREVDYDLTKTSGLVLARFSLFYAGRNNYRVFVMNRLNPPFSRLAQSLGHDPAPVPSGDALVDAAVARFRTLAAAVAPYGVRVVALVPPGFTPGDKELLEAGRRAGVEVSIPFRAGALPRRLFADATHLNTEGAAIFTAAIEAELLPEIPRPQPPQPVRNFEP